MIEYTESVAACLVDDRAPTPPLKDFIADSAKDSNLVWQLGTGHMSDLLDEALTKLEEEEEEHQETFLIMQMLADLLRQIAIVLKGPEPELTTWSWHDLPQLVTKLKEQTNDPAIYRRSSKAQRWLARWFPQRTMGRRT